MAITRTLTNYELTEKVKSLQRQVCCCPETPVDCEQVDVCLGISALGNPALFLNEQGNFVASGGVDTNFANDNLTFDADRTHDAATFGFTIDGITVGGVVWSLEVSNLGNYNFTTTDGTDSVTTIVSPASYTIGAGDGTNTGQVSIEPELLEFSSTDVGDSSAIQIAPSLITLNATGDYYLGDQAGGNLPPVEAPTWDLGLDALGKVVLTAGSGGGDILQGGNSFGVPVTIGSNDDFGLNFETSGVERVNITGDATTGGAVTITNVTANTATVQDVLTLRTNSTGTPAADFGGAILFQGESDTTDNQDMVRLSAIWTTATHASRDSALVYSDVTNGVMAERFRFTTTSMTIVGGYTIGNSTSALTIGGSTGLVNISSSGTNGITLTASSTTTGNVTVGTTAFTSTTLAKEALDFTDTYTVASGAGTFTALAIDNTFNLTGTASGIQRGIDINPTLTSLTAATYRGIDIPYSNIAAYGIYQSGPLTRNVFQGVMYLSDEAGGNLPAQEAAVWDLGLDVNGKVVIQDATNESIEHIGATFDGAGAVLVPNDSTTTWYAYVGYDATITAVTLFADQVGDIVVDVWVDSFANYPPTIADTITAAAIPTITAGITDQDTTLTGWTVAIPANSFVGFSVLSVTDITRVGITLTVVKD